MGLYQRFQRNIMSLMKIFTLHERKFLLFYFSYPQNCLVFNFLHQLNFLFCHIESFFRSRHLEELWYFCGTLLDPLSDVFILLQFLARKGADGASGERSLWQFGKSGSSYFMVQNKLNYSCNTTSHLSIHKQTKCMLQTMQILPCK